jgi:hypothetical protein
MDRIVVDHFDSFNDIGKVIDFESALTGCVSVDELSNMDAFRNATAENYQLRIALLIYIHLDVCKSCSKTSTVYGPQLLTE